jgi:acetolactate synthase-1/2/3 large subunit
MVLTGAEIVIRCLQEEKVDYLFGYPGGSVLYIYDELFKQDKVRHVLVRHEQAAVHAADGYARSTDKVGVALVTSGPGATNAVTGIATAYCDSIPLVVISGQVPSAVIGQDAFQEVDTVGITRPCVKHNFLVRDVRDIADTIKKAFTWPRPAVRARCWWISPRTSPPRSASSNTRRRSRCAPTTRWSRGITARSRRRCSFCSAPAPDGLYRRWRGARRCGRQADRAGAQARLPCTNTLMGLGGYPATDRQFVGMLGMHGTYEANMAMHYCDVLLAVGARFDDRVIGSPAHFASEPRKIIHIDIDPSSISKRVKVDVPIVGHVDEVLGELLASRRPPSAPIKSRWASGGSRSRNGVAATASSSTRAKSSSSRSSSSRSCGKSPAATPS